MTTLDEQIRIASDSIRRMAEATAASSVPKLATLLQMVADNERSMADLCAASGTSAYAIERAVGMTWPRPTNAELLSMTPTELDDLAERTEEFGRRVAYVRRRYLRGGALGA